MMKVMYEVSTFALESGIAETPVARLTPKMVVLPDGTKHLIESNYTRWFHTKQEAVDYLRNRLEIQERNAAKRHSEAKDALATFTAQHPE